MNRARNGFGLFWKRYPRTLLCQSHRICFCAVQRIPGHCCASLTGFVSALYNVSQDIAVPVSQDLFLRCTTYPRTLLCQSHRICFCAVQRIPGHCCASLTGFVSALLNVSQDINAPFQRRTPVPIFGVVVVAFLTSKRGNPRRTRNKSILFSLCSSVTNNKKKKKQ